MADSTTREKRSRMVTGMFRDRDSAENAYRSLTERGYTKDDVNLMMSDEARKRHFPDDDTELGNKALEGAGIGGGIGLGLGALITAILAAGAPITIPGLVVAGPLAGALVGGGAGAATGGVIGALVGAGIPEERAKVYEKGINEGGIVMGVNPRSDDDANYIEQEWRRHRGEEIYR
ncbi:MAG TPA: hypothetical protein VIG62_01300 [Blastocatellia bacterium]|jgi:hypothetical protein